MFWLPIGILNTILFPWQHLENNEFLYNQIVKTVQHLKWDVGELIYIVSGKKPLKTF